MTKGNWAIGVDLGATKIEVARVNAQGRIERCLRRLTAGERGPAAVEADIVAAVRELLANSDGRPVGVGVGVAGQIEPTRGVVRFAPNLGWRDEPLQNRLSDALDLPLMVTNDVRAATWGEWLHGACRGCDDLACLFVGTGIGGGVVSGGRMLSGCSNTAGELGHITIDLHGPACRCGSRGCLEALAGGWAIARRAQQALDADPVAAAALLDAAGGRRDALSAKAVAQAALSGDALAARLVDEVAEALIAGAVSVVNAFNPRRLILGGGVIEGLPVLVTRVDQGLRRRALPAATGPLRVLRAELHNDAAVIGAAVLAIRSATE